MSLLLDALKKAADDKQKASQDNVVENNVTKKIPEPTVDEPSAKAVSADENVDVELSDVTVSSEEFTLDAETFENDQLKGDELVLEEVVTAGQDVEQDDVKLELETKEQTQGHPATPETIRNSGAPSVAYSVSDEALSLLIDKTNRAVKQKRKIVVIGVLFVSLLVLVAGGFYYYSDMEAEIVTIEQKHRLAMRSMQSKMSQEKAPEESAIIRNLVGTGDLDDKVKYAKKRMAEEGVKPRVNNTQKRNSLASQSQTPGLSIQKTNKVDPVGERLDSAWRAYESGEYVEAKNTYKSVLLIEENNRDALLGLGAIAIVESDDLSASDAYLTLLKLDPRDPIANAAMTSLKNSQASLGSNEAHLLSMLKKNPDAPQLNFSLGNIYAQQKKWTLAQASYFSAWQADDENADYIFNLAVSLDQINKPQQAISFYRDSLLKSKNKKVSFSREAVEKRIIELSEL